MTKPNYKIGDRINGWRIAQSYFAPPLNAWVYKLELISQQRQLTCTEDTIDRMTKSYEKST